MCFESPSRTRMRGVFPATPSEGAPGVIGSGFCPLHLCLCSPASAHANAVSACRMSWGCPPRRFFPLLAAPVSKYGLGRLQRSGHTHFSGATPPGGGLMWAGLETQCTGGLGLGEEPEPLLDQAGLSKLS